MGEGMGGGGEGMEGGEGMKEMEGRGRSDGGERIE